MTSAYNSVAGRSVFSVTRCNEGNQNSVVHMVIMLRAGDDELGYNRVLNK
jgi:hypothetical protein